MGRGSIGEILAPGQGLVRVSACPHPFSMARVDLSVEAGATIAEIFARAQPDAVLRRHAHVFVGDHYIPRENWHRVRPKPGTTVSIRVVPSGGGGGGKNPLRTILMIAVLVGAAAISGGALAGVFGAGTLLAGSTGATIVAAGVGLVGSLLVNAIAPPPRPDLGQLAGPSRESPVFGIAGGRNELRPFQPVPRVLGKHRLWGPKGAREYTEIVGDDQYLRTLIVWGYGPLLLEDFKIGETPLDLFEDVEVEHRQGFDDDDPISLFPDDVFEEGLAIALLAADSWQVRTTQPDADEISIDVTFLQGLVEFDSQGAKKSRSVSLEVQTAVAGSGSWSASTAINVSAARSSVVRKSVRLTVTRGQYDVRIRRVTADTTSSSIFDVATWTSLRTFTNEPPVNMAGVAMTALRIRATNQLSGVVDALNCVATSILADWDGSDWETVQATANPASIYREVLQGTANANPVADARIDLATLEAWHEINTAAGREFNAVIDTPISVRDLLAAVAAAGRASLRRRDNKRSVVFDEAQSTVVQHFTPRNSLNFNATRVYADMPHALRVTFFNREQGWQADERIVYRDGYDAGTATKFEGYRPFGITDPAHIWSDTRYHMAVAELRPERYEFETDIEHIVCTRGDLIEITHDVLLVGRASGRIKSTITDGGGNITGIVSDEVLPMEADKDYALIVRAPGGRVSASVTTDAGEQTTVTLSPALAPGAVAAGDLFGFGEAGLETIRSLVYSIRRLNDEAAIIAAVPESAAVYTADTGAIPAFDSKLSPLVSQNKPFVISARSDDTVMVRAADGTLDSRILIALGAPGSLALSRISAIEAQFKPSTSDGAWLPLGPFPRDTREISVAPVEDGVSYDIRLRYAFTGAPPGQWTLIVGHVVLGKLTPPPAVDEFAITRLADGTRRFSWSALTIPPDVVLGGGFVIRYKAGGGGAWADMTPLFTQGLLQTSPVETNELAAGSYTFGIKMVDAFGNESLNANLIEATIGDQRLRGVIHQRVEFDLGFPGTLVDCFLNTSGHVEAMGDATTGTWDDLPATWDDLPDTWRGIVANRSPITYTTEVIDLGADIRFTPSVTFDGLGTATITMETGTDADGEPTGGFVALTSVTARYIHIKASVAGTTPLIRNLVTLLDGETVIQDVEDLDTSGASAGPFESIATGHFKYESDGRLASIITAQIVAFQNDGEGGRKVDLLSKATTITGGSLPAAEFKIYKDVAGTWTLTDATVDLELKGFKV